MTSTYQVYSVDHLYTALAELQMDPVIFTEWSRYSAKHNDAPPITELEEFAVECRRLLDCVDKTKTTGRQQPTPLQQ